MDKKSTPTPMRQTFGDPQGIGEADREVTESLVTLECSPGNCRAVAGIARCGTGVRGDAPNQH